MLHEYNTDDVSTVAAGKTNVSLGQLVTESILESKEDTSASMRDHFSFSGSSDTV
jgi:hypothetical protein